MKLKMTAECCPHEEIQQPTSVVYNIQRGSTTDGPGIRTVVFFKGCNLRCQWCHNPESISFEREVLFHPERCIGCGYCINVCPVHAHALDEKTGEHIFDRQLCTGCLLCTKQCFSEALLPVGYKTTVEEVMQAILTDVDYYRQSHGGVTFSGGECMAQPDFLAALLKQCRQQGIETAVDTAGNVPWAYFAAILDDTDLFLYDIKALDPAVHQQITGSDNARILDNFCRLLDCNAKIHIRVPLIPDINESEMAGIGEFLKGRSIEQIDLLPYHLLGAGKNSALGINGLNSFHIPTKEKIDAAVVDLSKSGIHVTV